MINVLTPIRMMVMVMVVMYVLVSSRHTLPSLRRALGQQSYVVVALYDSHAPHVKSNPESYRATNATNKMPHVSVAYLSLVVFRPSTFFFQPQSSAQLLASYTLSVG
jgi:hypothetical protein